MYLEYSVDIIHVWIVIYVGENILFCNIWISLSVDAYCIDCTCGGWLSEASVVALLAYIVLYVVGSIPTQDNYLFDPHLICLIVHLYLLVLVKFSTELDA